MRSLARALATLLAGLLLLPAALAQTVVFVDTDASGASDGTSWADAYRELSDALAGAPDGAQIWVAEGVYTPTAAPDRTGSFVLRAGVEILGGFTGTETSADERVADPDENQTVLSCDIGVAADPADNCYHVVTALDVDETAVLDGFLVTGGQADAEAPNDRGGGLTNSDGGTGGPDTEGSPTLRNVVFAANHAVYGGGAYLHTTALPVRMAGVTFRENTASLWGGGLLSNADVEADSVRFRANVAAERGGGAFFGGTSSVVIRGGGFEANRVGTDETAGRGAGFNAVEAASVTLLDTDFVRNAAPLTNESDGGGFNAAENAVVNLVNATFVGNVARSGAGLFMRSTTALTVANAVFAGNRSQDDGGSSIVTVTAGASARLAGVTLSGNRANAVLSSNTVNTVEVLNAVLWGNSDLSILVLGSSIVDVDHAIVEGGFPSGAEVLTADPLFNAAPDAGADGEWGTDDDSYGNLRLQPASPAQGFGDLGLVPADTFDLDGDGVTDELLPLDLEGEARVQDGSVELGAYEGATTPVASEPGTAPAGRLALSAARPNPARGRAAVALTLAAAGRVELTVVDRLGRRLVRLHDGPMAAGEHAVEIDAAALPAGLYVLRATTETGTVARRFTVVR